MLPVTSGTKECVLLVKTNEAFTQKASLALRETGYLPLAIPDVQEALAQVEQIKPAMIAIDSTKACEMGFTFCSQLRSAGNRVPMVMLLEQETVAERAKVLEAGADDYLLKPYLCSDFLQLVRQYLPPQKSIKEQLCFGELVLDLTARRVLLKGKEINLTMKVV